MRWTPRSAEARGAELSLKPELDLTPAVLERILPGNGASLACDRLAFDNARAGDFDESPFRTSRTAGSRTNANVQVDCDDVASAREDAAEGLDSFTLVEPQRVNMRVVPAAPPVRDSYSYSSISAELHEEGEDLSVAIRHRPGRTGRTTVLPDEVDALREERAAALAATRVGDPTALGSAFHAACQWLIELDRAELPAERADALVPATWGCTPEQRVRFDEAMARWLSSGVRAEALAWPCRRAEVPFYTLGMDGLAERFGAYAEGAIDLLCTSIPRTRRARC